MMLRAGTTVVTGVSRSADGGVAVTVTDDGAGIPAEFVDRVFARFARADASRAVRVPSGEGAAAPGSAGQASAEGTSGLRLSIVQSIVEAHWGVLSTGVFASVGKQVDQNLVQL